MTIRDLVRIYSEGDEVRVLAQNGLALLYQRYYQECLIYALSLSRDRYQAEELVSEAFYQLLLALDSLQEEQVKFWLFRVIKHRFIDAQRRKERWRKWHLLHRGSGVSDETPLKDLLSGEERQELLSVLEKLPPEERELILLHYFLDWSLDDIAVLKEMTYGQTKNRLYRIRKSLKGALTNEKDDRI